MPIASGILFAQCTYRFWSLPKNKVKTAEMAKKKLKWKSFNCKRVNIHTMWNNNKKNGKKTWDSFWKVTKVAALLEITRIKYYLLFVDGYMIFSLLIFRPCLSWALFFAVVRVDNNIWVAVSLIAHTHIAFGTILAIKFLLSYLFYGWIR